MDKATLDKLLKFGVERGASDIHFEVGGPPRFRIKGDLLKAKYEPLTPEMTLAIARHILREREVDLERLFPEIDSSYSIPGVSRFRVSIFRQRGSVGCVLRAIPFMIRSLDELHLPPVIKDIANTRRGLVLVTGATGMGKSTTIATMLDQVNQSRAAHIITIEDPIEFLYENKAAMVIQREVGVDTVSYFDGMIAALRQDPDMIMLGEVRDEKSAQVCLKAAETGHVVVTTLHTPDALSTVKRYCGFFDPARAAVDLGRFAECLQASVSLRLVRTADGTGVMPAVEILRVTHTLQDCIRNPDKHGEILQHMVAGRDMYGMQTFDQHLADLVRAEKVTLETAKLAASSPADLERSLTLE